MPEKCSRRKCEHERYGNREKCIFHCEKTDFTEADIKIFWESIRVKYLKSDFHGNIAQDSVFEDVIFPRFEDYSAYSKNNFFKTNYVHFVHNMTFKKCTFLDDFNLLHTVSNKKITFDNCTFHGSIILARLSEISIENSTFKNEVLMGNNQWNTVELKDVKFFKQATINVQAQMKLLDCTFNDVLSLYGFDGLTIYIENGAYKKAINLNNIYHTKIACPSQEKYLELRSDVIFNACDNILLYNVHFHKQSHFGENQHYEIIIDNTTLNDVLLHSGGVLKVVNQSKINGKLNIKGIYENLHINNSQIKKETDIHQVKNVHLKNAVFTDKSSFNGEHNDFSISDNCSFKDLSINSINSLIVKDSSIEGELKLLGEKYERITIKNTSISDTLQITDVKKLELESIKAYPSLKLIHQKYEDISIKNSRLTDVEINSAISLHVVQSIMRGTLKLFGEGNRNITFDTVILRNGCEFPNLNLLSLKNCRLRKEIVCKNISNLESIKTIYRSDINFLADCTTLQLVECQFYKTIKLSRVSNFMDIKACMFKGEVDFTAGMFKKISIFSSTFERDLSLEKSTIHDITFDSIDKEKIKRNEFLSNVDFTQTDIGMIEINHCLFQNQLKFLDLRDNINLHSIQNTTIKNLMIINSFVFELFANSVELKISNFTLANSKLDTRSSSNEIDLNGIIIDVFQCNKVSFLKNMNLDKLKIKKFTIDDSNIEHTLRIKYSDIDIFTIKSSIFEDLQIIDNKAKGKEKKEFVLENTTIKNTVLDKLKYDRFEMTSAHISDAKIGLIEFQKGSRETNRFLKNYYDSISDYITANEYYKQEMEEQLKASTTTKREKFILCIGKITSDFGQSWTRPLGFMIVVSILLFLYIHWQVFYSYGWNYIWCNKLTILDSFAMFLNPFDKTVSAQNNGHYIVWLTHKLLMTIFIYHFIVAVKRKTKR